MPQPAQQTSSADPPDARQVAEAVRNACIEAAQRSYEDARMRGLCAEGAWEAAVGAMRSLNVEQVADEQIRNRQSKIQN